MGADSTTEKMRSPPKADGLTLVPVRLRVPSPVLDARRVVTSSVNRFDEIRDRDDAVSMANSRPPGGEVHVGHRHTGDGVKRALHATDA